MTETVQNIKFSTEALAKAKTIIARYPEGKQKSALLPLLHLAQQEFDGWLDVPVMDYIAEILDIQPIEVYEVASFYTMYNLKAVGKHILEVCQTGPCCLRGSERVVKYIEEKLGIKNGETTPDGLFTLRTVECLASCGTAPMMQVGDDYHENLTEEKIDQLITNWKNNTLTNKEKNSKSSSDE